MASGPSVSSEAWECQKEVRNGLAADVNEALTNFMEQLDSIALNHGRYVYFLDSHHFTVDP